MRNDRCRRHSRKCAPMPVKRGQPPRENRSGIDRLRPVLLAGREAFSGRQYEFFWTKVDVPDSRAEIAMLVCDRFGFRKGADQAHRRKRSFPRWESPAFVEVGLKERGGKCPARIPTNSSPTAQSTRKTPAALRPLCRRRTPHQAQGLHGQPACSLKGRSRRLDQDALVDQPYACRECAH